MINIGVITDNHKIVKEFERVIRGIDMSINLNYYCSKPSNIEDFEGLKIQPIDLKKNFNSLIEKKFSIIFSIHCKQLFPSELVKSGLCVNLHPGYNPINRGWYPQVFSIINNLETGATLHVIDEQLDHGLIIARKKVDKFGWDTSLSLYNRIVDAEIELLEENLESLLLGKFTSEKPENEGNLFLKKDFNDLLKIDLDKKATYGEVIDHLRSLSHEDFKNAYFVDKETGKKVYLSINIKIDI